ncbi:MAG TPA: glycoside hydrolase family 3 N-terminal domain-containing protein, partial [Spirochaetia bacterium]|nr:glycoside hydrolase family 3 N-terminal domain-containing protein [Spirochaetia bacterium]
MCIQDKDSKRAIRLFRVLFFTVIVAACSTSPEKKQPLLQEETALNSRDVQQAGEAEHTSPQAKDETPPEYTGREDSAHEAKSLADGTGGYQEAAGSIGVKETEQIPAIEHAPAYLMPRNRPLPPDDRALSVLNSLSLRQKIGQRFIGYLPGTEITEEAKTLIRDCEISGFILYKKNFETAEGAAAITQELKSEAGASSHPIGLFLALDQEGGRVAALRFRETTQFPPAYYWSRYRDPAYVRAAAYITAAEMKHLGFNMNFAPVLDVYGIPDSSIIGDRSFGDDPFINAELGTAYIQTMASAGIIAVPKHFPGH